MKSFVKKMFVAMAAAAAMLLTMNCSQVGNDAVAVTADVQQCTHGLLARESGKCSCGGRLKSKYVYVKKPCPACDGRGHHDINGSKRECTMCYGEKTIDDFVGVEYICTRCGKRYKNYYHSYAENPSATVMCYGIWQHRGA